MNYATIKSVPLHKIQIGEEREIFRIYYAILHDKERSTLRIFKGGRMRFLKHYATIKSVDPLLRKSKGIRVIFQHILGYTKILVIE